MTVKLQAGLGIVRPDTDRWRELQAATFIDLSSPSAPSNFFVLLLPDTDVGFNVVGATAVGSDLTALLQDGVKGVLESSLQRVVDQPITGAFDAHKTWGNVMLMAELLGQPTAQIWQSCTLQNFATALVSSRHFQDNIRSAFARVDGGMLLYPNEGNFFPPSVPDVRAGLLPLTAPEGQGNGYGIYGT